MGCNFKRIYIWCLILACLVLMWIFVHRVAKNESVMVQEFLLIKWVQKGRAKSQVYSIGLFGSEHSGRHFTIETLNTVKASKLPKKARFHEVRNITFLSLYVYTLGQISCNWKVFVFFLPRHSAPSLVIDSLFLPPYPGVAKEVIFLKSHWNKLPQEPLHYSNLNGNARQQWMLLPMGMKDESN